ncbi:MAG TPA: TerC family protein [Rhizomicrobium sp.]|nr:TerC family protein [Rhizomicrobium sp.]
MFELNVLSPALVALLQVILIDIVLAGDNAVVIGMAAAKVPHAQRRKVIFWGLAAAVVIRVVLATLAAELLAVIGLMFAGGILLLWVCWRLWRDFQNTDESDVGTHTITTGNDHPHVPRPPLSESGIRKAIVQIVLADISMSLDNVLAVAGAAMNHVWVLAIGLLLSIAMMGIAAAMVANLLRKYPWISYAGLIIVLYVALRMIWFGGADILLNVALQMV